MMADPAAPRRPDLSALKIDESARGRQAWGARRSLWVVVAVVAVAAAAGGIYAARVGGVEVQVSEVRAAAGGGQGVTGAAVLNASGYVTPRRRATVSAEVTGRVTEMLVEEGMRVEAGQVIARLDDAQARAALKAAEAETARAIAAISELDVSLAEAGRTLGRARELAGRGIVSTQDLDRAQAGFDALKARLEVAREEARTAEARIAVAAEEVDNSTVRAPFAGIAVSKDAQPGEIVSPISAGGGYTRTGIATIVDMESLEIEVDVNESRISRVSPGQRAEATLDAYPDWRIPAKVRTVIPTADRQKATVKVRIAFDELDPRILPDMGVKVAFLGEEEAAASASGAGRTLVPRAAVRQEDGKAAVFLLSEGKIERRAVKVGDARGGDVEILAGLAEGDRVVVGGPEGLRDGQAARAR